MAENAFHILALPGGGFLGLHALTVLAEIEEQIGHPIGRHFDLIAGTSIGGIAALGVASEISAARLAGMFLEHGQDIFPKKTFYSGLFSSRFSPSPLQNAVQEVLEDGNLGDAKRNVIVPALNLSRGSPSIFKTPHHESFKQDWKFKMTDIAMATSAAPLMFPIAEVDGRLFADGAFFASSPEMIALHEANVFFEIPDKKIRILTVGTTTSKVSQGHTMGKNWGAKKWLSDLRILEFMMASQVSIVREMVKHRLGNRLHVIDSDRGKYSADEIGLTVATEHAAKTLTSLGKEAAKDFMGSSDFQTFVDHTPRPINFHYGQQAKKGAIDA